VSGGGLSCSGQNNYGQLGTGNGPDRATPMAIAALGSVTGTALGGYHACAKKADGSLWCWGLGETQTPVKNTTLIGKVVDIGAGLYSTCARLEDARLCYGESPPIRASSSRVCAAIAARNAGR
jgi:alpha-tubulin suppressor-like RCC1 family protein